MNIKGRGLLTSIMKFILTVNYRIADFVRDKICLNIFLRRLVKEYVKR